MTTPHTIELYRSTETVSSDLGGINRTFPATGISLKAFVQYKTDTYAVINQTEGNNTSIAVYLASAISVKDYDRVKYNGLWFEVRSILFGSGPRGVQYTKLICSGNNQI